MDGKSKYVVTSKSVTDENRCFECYSDATSVGRSKVHCFFTMENCPCPDARHIACKMAIETAKHTSKERMESGIPDDPIYEACKDDK